MPDASAKALKLGSANIVQQKYIVVQIVDCQ